MPIEGYIVGIAFTLGVFLCFAVALFDDWKMKPKSYVNGVGVTFKGTADKNIKGIPEAITTLRVELEKLYASDVVDRIMNNLVIELYGPEDVMRTGAIPTGTVKGDDGKQHIITGTVDPYHPWTFAKLHFRVLVRELFDAGIERTFGHTAFYHEVAEHIRPFVLHGDWNPGHKLEYQALTNELEAAYAVQMGEHKK